MTLPIPALTIPQVCAALQVGRSTVYKLIRRKRLKARKVGRLTRVRQTDLEAFLGSSSARR